MLYIASALTPTLILGSLTLPSLTSPGSQSLVIAKSDRIEVWDLDKSGLVHRAELELWGNVIAIDKVEIAGARPHILVLLSPPNAHLILLTYTSTPSPTLVVTSALPLTPPTPSLRQAEFFSSVLAHENVALVSLWVGVLSCVEMEVEKEKDAKRRRSSAAIPEGELEEGKKLLRFRDNFNINVREHNLLHLAFLPNPTVSGPLVTFLWLSPSMTLQIQTRILSSSSHSFIEVSRPIDVVSPTRSPPIDADADFNEVPFSCPAARRVMPIPTTSSHERMILVMGDEHSVLYSLALVPQSPRASRLSGSSNVATSPRASAVKRSPQTEMMGAQVKKRKSSMTAKRPSLDGGERWEMRPVWRIRQGFGTILASTVLQSHEYGASVLIGDECGRLTAIAWEFDRGQGILETPPGLNGAVRVTKVDMGVSSPPSSISHLSSSHVFLSSACGDSLVLRLSGDDSSQTNDTSASSRVSPRGIPARKGKDKARDREEDEDSGWRVELEEQNGQAEVLERWMNLAPVKDFAVIEEEGRGASHLVVASGASTSNSLRLVRSGVGLEETVSVEGLHGIERMWTLSPSPGTTNLLVSTDVSTHLLTIDPEIEDASICSQLNARPTLAAGLLPGGQLLATVCPDGVELWSDLVNGEKVGAWMVQPGQDIVAAQVEEGYIIVAKRGGEVAVLSTKQHQLEHVISATIPAEVSALSMLSNDALPSPIIAVSTWTNEILVYALSDLVASSGVVHTLTENAFASSLLLKLSNSNNTSSTDIQLLAGLSDGGLVVYDLALADVVGGIKELGRKASSLGTRPLRLEPVKVWQGGEENVVAVGLSERMSVIFENKDRLDFSSVSKRDVVAATSINTPLGSQLVLATRDGLTLSKVNSLKKLHVQTLDLKEKSVTRLAAVPELGILAVGTVTRSMDAQTGEVIQKGSFELRDDTALKVLSEISLLPREEITSITPVTLLTRRYIAIGTAVFASDAEFDDAAMDGDFRVTAKEGRMLLVEPAVDAPTGEWKSEVVVIVKTVGPVHDVAVIHGFLAIAAASKVSINRFTLNPLGIKELSSFSSMFVAQHLRITPESNHHPEERLVVGDGMRSVFVLDVDMGSGEVYGDQRDMATYQVMGMEGVRDGGEGMIISDGHSNLLTFRLKDQIEPAASFGLHEDVARFRQGSLAPPSSAPEVINPDLLFATTDGRLGVIGELTPAAARTMDELQRNMDRYWKGPGGISWKTWRRGGTELIKRETAGFVDGDFVQKFLDTDLLPSSEAERILTGTNSHERVSRLDKDGAKVPAERGDVARVLEAAAGLH